VTKNVAIAAPPRAKLGVRAGVSRKLLERKALETAAVVGEPTGDALEDSFPTEVHDQPDRAEPVNATAGATDGGQAIVEQPGGANDIVAATALGAAAPAPHDAVQPAPEQPTPTQAPQLATLTTWSADDERAFQTLAARRKAAGYQRRGRDVSDQVVRVGGITPNPNTIVAVIVGLVTERGGSVSRSELVTAMAGASYPHGRAKPEDKGWCQGYVAGAVRNGFLTLAEDVVVADAAWLALRALHLLSAV
jgi:hypothetical protein